MLDKPTTERIFNKLITDVKKCFGNITDMEKLYKQEIEEEEKFYNRVLLDIIHQRQTDLDFVGEHGEIYL
jgi:hypothetical protein